MSEEGYFSDHLSLFLPSLCPKKEEGLRPSRYKKERNIRINDSFLQIINRENTVSSHTTMSQTWHCRNLKRWKNEKSLYDLTTTDNLENKEEDDHKKKILFLQSREMYLSQCQRFIMITNSKKNWNDLINVTENKQRTMQSTNFSGNSEKSKKTRVLTVGLTLLNDICHWV